MNEKIYIQQPKFLRDGIFLNLNFILKNALYCLKRRCRIRYWTFAQFQIKLDDVFLFEFIFLFILDVLDF